MAEAPPTGRKGKGVGMVKRSDEWSEAYRELASHYAGCRGVCVDRPRRICGTAVQLVKRLDLIREADRMLSVR